MRKNNSAGQIQKHKELGRILTGSPYGLYDLLRYKELGCLQLTVSQHRCRLYVKLTGFGHYDSERLMVFMTASINKLKKDEVPNGS